MAEMSFAEYNDMVKTIPPDRTDEPLRISVLPWRTWRNRPIPYAHCAKPPDDDSAINAIPITNDIPWRLLPTVSLSQLTRDPMGARARGHPQPQKLAPRMLQNQKSIQQPKRDRRDYEQKIETAERIEGAASGSKRLSWNGLRKQDVDARPSQLLRPLDNTLI
jgi:hypothetical protein